MKVKLLGMLSLLALTLTSCGGKGSYSVNVIDIDGEKIFSKTEEFNNGDKLLDLLKKNTVVDSNESQFGNYVTSIAGSIKDSNYYLAIYENGKYSETGIDEIKVDNGDVFDFKVEPYREDYLENDKILDKALYGYSKKLFKKNISSVEDFSVTSNYWDFMTSYLMTSEGYESFNIEEIVNPKLVDNLKNFSLSALTGQPLGKYYYIGRACGIDMKNFKDYYTTYVSKITTYGGEYSEYTHFIDLSPAYSVIDSQAEKERIYNMMNNYSCNTEYGFDGFTWFLASKALFGTIKNHTFPTSNQTNAISEALLLLPFSASLDFGYKQILNYLIENYYDKENNVFYYNNDKKAEGDNFASANQIYASLATIKVMRDKNKVANLFA